MTQTAQGSAANSDSFRRLKTRQLDLQLAVSAAGSPPSPAPSR